jgi:crotonobetainyl-CoA:carnitine CoA-transferase CaiB-like acyl-CoA transferase
MIVSNIFLNYEEAFDHEGKAPRPPVDPRQFGIGATHRLYECASSDDGVVRAPYENPDPHWVMLVADDDQAFGRLCRVASRDDLVADPRFATAAARVEHRTALEEELVAVFLNRSAHDWEAALQAVGVGCVVADEMSHFAFLFEDTQAQAIEMMTPVSHPSIGGTYYRYSPVLELSDTPSRATTFCDLGEHTRALLAELGYDEATIEQLAHDGVVGVPPVPAEV